MDEKRERIKIWVAACMVIIALTVDGSQMVLTALGIGLVLGPILSVCAYTAFWIWFMILGVSFTSNPKKLFSFGGSGIAEIIPLFGALPVFTAGIITVVMLTMAEDKGGIIGEAAGAMQGKLK